MHINMHIYANMYINMYAHYVRICYVPDKPAVFILKACLPAKELIHMYAYT
jgi:hypothetical protein